MSTEFKLYADFQRYNFFRVPSWRWERVLQLVDRMPTPGRCTRRDDDFVRQARNFLLRWKNRDLDIDREELWFDAPGLYYAYQFFLREQNDREGACFLQARLLANQPYVDIAEAMGITADAIRWYEALFFNVGDKLKHRDWITKHVLVPAFKRPAAVDDDGEGIPAFRDSTVARPFLDGSLKLFSYFGGPLVAEVMISGMRSGNVLASREDSDQWFDKIWSDAVRRRSGMAAMHFEINKYNVMELFAVHTRIMEIEKSTDNQDQQKSAMEKHVLAAINEIPWAAGQDGEDMHRGTVLGRIDDMAAELRDDEILKIASGETLPGLTNDFPDRLPPPRRQKESIVLKAEPVE